jgi:hypothetical protein
MTYHTFFWAVCAVVATHIVVAVISFVKAYRDERKLSFSKPVLITGRERRGNFSD